MYNQDIMERFLNPCFAGIIRGASGVGSAKDPNTNETIKLYIEVNADAVITDAKFKAFGCPVVIAVADALSQMIVGMPIEQAQELNEARVLNMFNEIPQERLYSIFLAIDALNETIDDYAKKLRKLQKKLLADNKDESTKSTEDDEHNEENTLDTFNDYYDE